MRTILYSISTGYVSRNLLRVGILERLLKNVDIRVVIVTPTYNDAEFVKGFSFSDRIFFEKMHEVDESDDFLIKVIWKLWKMRHRHRVFQGLYKAVLKIYHFLKYDRLYTDIFDKYEPDLVIGATVSGIDTRRDFPLLIEAQKEGIKTLVLINSWDNLSERKGPPFVRPDYIGVWNEMQKQDAIEAQLFDEQRVKIVGPPHFDFYWKKDTYIERGDFCKKMGLDPQKKLISVIATVSNLVKNYYIVDILLEALRKKEFILPVQLLCRPQPSYFEELNVLEYAKYDKISEVLIDRQFHENKPKMKWMPDEKQIFHFANLIKHTDVQVNIASTSTIEAAILDKPVVNVAFSTIEPELFKKRVLESVYTSHYQVIVKTGATHIAHTSHDLINGINEYLRNPHLHQEGRKRLVKAAVYSADGRSVERVYQTIIDLLPATI